MSKCYSSVPWLFISQVILLVLYYGNILPTLPWFVVWLPSLIALVLIGILAIILLFAGVVALLNK